MTRRLQPVGHAQQRRWLAWIIAAIIVLNVLDALFTLFWVRAGLARETNPLLRWLVNEHPVWFTVTKLALVLLGTFVLWRSRHRPLAVIGIGLIFIVYCAILIHHLSSSSALLVRLGGQT